MDPFPESGEREDVILARVNAARTDDLRSDGRAFAFVYDAGDATRAMAREVFAACMPVNGLDPTVYPSARTLERGLVAACLSLVRAPAGAVGTATAGGTESILLAVKSARDHARSTRAPGAAPKMLLPITAHAAFHKAAHYLGVEVIPVDVDASFRADVADARRKMTSDVILVVGSAPSYAHGVVDPIRELAELAHEHGVAMHVDACVGGMVLPFLRDLGRDVPEFDFTVPHVTSLSMDLHKYGYAPKGSSMLVLADPMRRRSQYFACARWTGYTIVNSTSLGSKSIAATGAAYATILALGREGFRTRARAMAEATDRLVAFVASRPELRLLAKPDMNLFAFTTSGGDVFELADRIAARGFLVQPTYAFGPSPAHIHLTLDPSNAPRVDELAAAIAESLVDLPARPEPPVGLVAMLEAAAQAEGALDPGPLMASLGIAEGRLPTRMAPVHHLLDAASPALREELMVTFFGGLFS